MKTIIDNIWQQLAYDPKSPLLFNSGFFLWWFLIILVIFLAIEKRKVLKIAFLTFASIYFYYKSSGLFFILIIISTLIDYFAAQFIHRSKKESSRTFWLIISLCANLGLLGYFKYTNFLIDTFNSLTDSHFEFQEIFLPVGISFYTFQTMSYTIDVYRRKLEPLKNLLDFGFYVSFFPQLVAGPIVRAKDFIPQIKLPTVVTKEDVGKAIFLISAGLFKKAVISDYISINFVDRIFANPELYTGFENLMGVYGYALQIYCDFSGYSDMAIGLALLLGFKLNMNFDSPYQSSSITEFWRRWHISLSSWLKDYLYISLGGNRKGKFRQYINLMLTMLLGGLWHGASWKFVIWGGWHGLGLAVEKFFWTIFPGKTTRLMRILGILFTFHFVCASWILFRASSYQNAVDVMHQIWYNFNPSIAPMVLTGYKEIFLLLLIGYILHFIPRSMELKTEALVTRMPIVAKSLILVIVIWMVVQIKSSEVQPFIYFQF